MSLIAHTIKASTDGADVTTDDIDSTGADMILLTTSMFDSYGNTITDSYGNSYGAIASPLFGSLISFFAATQSYVCYNPVGGPGHNFSCTTTSKKPAIAVSAWSGVTGPPTIEDGQHTSASGTSLGYAPINPPAADTLIVLTLARNTASAASASTGFVVLGEVDPSANNVGLTHGYMITPDTSTVTPGWTWPTSSADRGGGFGVFTHTTTPPQHVGTGVFGRNTTVQASGSEPIFTSIAFGLDGNTNVLDENHKFKVFGRGEFTEDLKVIDPVDAQDAVPKHYCDSNAGASALNDLTDVIITIPTTGEVLKYNGTNWINDTDATGGGGGGIDTSTAAYGSRPAAGNAGDLFLPTNGVYIDRDNGTVWQPWGPLFPMTLPVDGDFAWVNQGSTAKDTTTGGIYLNAVGLGGNWRARVKTMPTPPFTITAWFRTMFVGTAGQGAGLCFRASGTDKQQWLFMDAAGGWTSRLMVEDYGPAYTGTLSNNSASAQGVYCLRIADDNTNRVYSYSLDGVNFIQLATQGRTTNFTANQVGFGVLYAATVLLSWKEA